MKSTVLFLMALIVSTATFAGNVNPESKSPKSMIVKTSEWNSDVIQVSIKDKFGVIVHEESLTKPFNDRRYDLSNLPEGDYSLEVSNGTKFVTSKFEVLIDKIEMAGEASTFFMPVVNEKDGKLELNMLSMGRKVEINILDRFGDKIFHKTETMPSIHKRFNLSALQAGEYLMQVSSEGKTFYKEFVKN